LAETVWKNGGKLESWTDYFSYERWMDAFKENNVDISFYTTRERSEDEAFPWDFADVGVKKSFLYREYLKAHEAQLSPDCRVQCTGCGANCFLEGGVCDA